MDQMLPSPSFNIPSIGTPHHAMEEDQNDHVATNVMITEKAGEGAGSLPKAC